MMPGDATAAVRAGRATVILGLDPGLAALGWGVVVVEGTRPRWRAHGVLRTAPQPGRTKGVDLAARLEVLAVQVAALLEAHQPQRAAMEEFRYYGRGVTSSLQLANVTGMLREALRTREVPLAEYAAQTLKATVAADTRASKAAVQRAVQRLLGLPKPPRPTHAADALAAALTHAFRWPLERALEARR
jgi:crossover junction endodeoxyribonuclease RuvC